ncbi:MAG: phage tail tape measure protein [Cyanobacteria bacterium SBLK]|nr:phage tail tape measure protein [Cyanobacteria bacterium SBLK]
MPKILTEFVPVGEKEIQKAIKQIAKEQNKSVKEISQNIGKYQGRIKELTGQVSAASAAWKGSQQAAGTLQNLTSATERLATIQKQQASLARESAKASLQSAKSRVSAVQQELNALKGKKASQQEIVAKTRELQKAQLALTKSSLGYERQVQAEIKRAAASERNIALDRQKAAATQRQTALTQELTRIQSQQNKGAISAGQAAAQVSQARIRASQKELAALRQQGASQNQIAKATQKLVQEKGRLNQALARNAAAAQKSVAANTNLQNRFDKLGASVAVMTGNLAASAIATGVNAVKGAIGEVFADYQQAIKDFEAIGSPDTLGNIDILKDKIKELGANTQKSAGEIASITPSLRTAGLSAEQSAASLSGIVDLTLVDKSGDGIDVLTKKAVDLGIAFDTIGKEDKFRQTLDTWTAAANSTNVTFGGLTNTLANMRGALKTANVDEASAASFAAIFAEGGQFDEKAGTAIGNMVKQLNLSLSVLNGDVTEAPTKQIEKQVQVLEELGITGEKASQLLSKGDWNEIYLEVAGLFQGIENDGQRADAFLRAFGDKTGKRVEAAMSVPLEKMIEIMGNAENAQGTLGDSADKMARSLKGSFKELGSVSEAIVLNLVEGAAPSLEKLTRLTTDALRFINGELSSADAGAFFESFNEQVDEALAILFEFGDRIGGDFNRIVAIAKEVGGSIGADILPGLQELGATGGDAIATLLELVSELFQFIRNDTPLVEIFGDTFAYGLGVANGVLKDSISLMEWLIDVVKLAGQNINNFLAGTDTDLVSQSAEELANLQRLANKKIDVEIGGDSEAIKKQISELKQVRDLVRGADVTGGQNRDTSKELKGQIDDRLKALREAQESLEKEGEGSDTTVKVKADTTPAKEQIGEILENAPSPTVEIEADTQPATKAIAEVPDTAPDPTITVDADTAPAEEKIAKLSSRDKEKAEEAIALRESQAIAAIKERAASGEVASQETIEAEISQVREKAMQDRLALVEAGNKEEAQLRSAIADSQISRDEAEQKAAESAQKEAEQRAKESQKSAEEAAKAAREAALEQIDKQEIKGDLKVAGFRLANPNADPEVIALQEIEVNKKSLEARLALEKKGSKEYLSIQKQIIEEEIKAQETLIALVQRRIDEEVNAQNRILKEQEIGYRSQANTIDLTVGSQQRQAELMAIQEGAIARQNDLLSAQNDLANSLTAIEDAVLDRRVENAKRGEDALKQLQDIKKAEASRKNEGKEESEREKIKREKKERDEAIKSEKLKRKALEKELKALGIDRNATIEEAVLARQKAEDARVEQELANFARQQEFERKSLALENQREASAKRRALIEARINIAKSKQAAIESQLAILQAGQERNSAVGELRKAREQGNEEAIADAELGVKTAEQSLSLSKQAASEAAKQIPIAQKLAEDAEREISAQQRKAAIIEQGLLNSQQAEAVSKVTQEQNRQLDQNRERAEVGAELRDIDVTVSLGRVEGPKLSQDIDIPDTASTEKLQEEISQQPPVKIPAELELSEQQEIVNNVNLAAQNELVELLKHQIELLRERAVLEAAETAEKLRAAQAEQQAIAENEGQGIAEKQARLDELNRPQLVGSFEEYEARKREKAALEEEIKAAEQRKAEAEKEALRLGDAIASTDAILEKSRERLEVARSQTSELEKQAALSERIAKATPSPNRIESGRLRGGLVSAGKHYPVVENARPEIYRTQSGQDYLLTAPQIFTPPKPGRIIPNEKTEAILRMQATLQRIGVPIRPASVTMSPQTIERVASQSGSGGSEKEFALLRKEIAGLKQELKRPIKPTFHQQFLLRSPDQSEVEKASRRAVKESMEYLRDLLQ